LFQSLDRLDR